MYVHVSTGACVGHKKVSYLLGLELETVVGLQMCIQETELWSLARVVCALTSNP